MLLLAFGIKAAVFPLSAWLPDSYPTAPAPVTAVFAGLLTKVGVYAIIRTQTLLFPGPRAAALLLVVAGLTMLVGILGAVAQSDLKRLLSFTLVSHIGYMIFGIGAQHASPGWSGPSSTWSTTSPSRPPCSWSPAWSRRQAGSTDLRRLGGLARIKPAARGALLRLGDEPRRHPTVLRLPRQARTAPGRRGGRRSTALDPGRPGTLTSLLTLYVASRVWSIAFWRAPGLAVASTVPLPTLMVGATVALVALGVGLTVVAGPLFDVTTERGGRPARAHPLHPRRAAGRAAVTGPRAGPAGPGTPVARAVDRGRLGWC